jgi:class 3 adenylate cyclase
VSTARKTVSILFCDITGSTALGEALDPESLREVVQRYFTEMRAVIERHGGTGEVHRRRRGSGAAGTMIGRTRLGHGLRGTSKFVLSPRSLAQLPRRRRAVLISG